MLRGLIKARPVASQLLRGAVVVPARAATFDPHYVPTVEELTRYENPNDQYSMLRNKSAHIAPPSLLSQADIKSADWYAELSEYLYKPTSFRTQTVPARARLRLVDEFGVAQAPGSRKSARAFAHIKPGTGAHVINGIPYSEYFASMEERMHAFEPLLLCGISSQVRSITSLMNHSTAIVYELYAHNASMLCIYCICFSIICSHLVLQTSHTNTNALFSACTSVVSPRLRSTRSSPSTVVARSVSLVLPATRLPMRCRTWTPRCARC